MIRFFGTAPGKRFEASAGANRGTIVLDASALSESSDGAAMAASSMTCVLTPAGSSPRTVWVIAHRGSRGTFHGLGRPSGDAPVGVEPSIAERRWFARSASRGGDHAAAVLVLEPGAEPVNMLTSGYDGRRGWTVTTFHSDGRVESQSLGDWRAIHAAPEAL